MRTYKLKCWPEPFAAMLDGRKNFEFRRDDRGFAVGDELILQEWDPAGRSMSSGVLGHHVTGGDYTGRAKRALVTYILRGQFGMPDGYVVMGLRPPKEGA